MSTRPRQTPGHRGVEGVAVDEDVHEALLRAEGAGRQPLRAVCFGPMAASKRRISTVFGWIAGGSVGLILDYLLYLVIGEAYPLIPATFALFVAGCFGGMWLADRLGERSFRVLGVAAGLLLALAVTFLVSLVLTRAGG